MAASITQSYKAEFSFPSCALAFSTPSPRCISSTTNDPFFLLYNRKDVCHHPPLYSLGQSGSSPRFLLASSSRFISNVCQSTFPLEHSMPIFTSLPLLTMKSQVYHLPFKSWVSLARSFLCVFWLSKTHTNTDLHTHA